MSNVTGNITAHTDGLAQRLIRKLMTTRPSKFIVMSVVIATIISGMATYSTLTETPEATDRIFWLINIDLGLFLILSVFVARQITRLWARRKEGLAGSQLHVRLVFIFGLLTAIPAILMTVFSVSFFYFGVQGWFSDRVSTAVNESIAVAEAYLDEHQQTMRADVLAMANDLNRSSYELVDNRKALESFVQTQSQLRNLSEALIFTSSGRVIARSRLAFTLEFDPIPERLMNQARNGDVVLLVSDQPQSQDRVRALVKLDQYVDTFLLVGRLVDSKVVAHLNNARDAVASYTELEGKRSSFQLSIMFMFIAVALLLLLLSIWLGLVFAGQLAGPITNLIKASEQVRSGDLSARVENTNPKDEIGALGMSFNNMTAQLQTQREELIHANRLIDERRLMMEAVLASASSGILGINQDGRIALSNPAAAKLFGYPADELYDEKLSDISPEFAGLLSKARAKVKTHEIDYRTPDGQHRIFSVRITGEQENGAGKIIITFDDVSPLMEAQRKAAWSDVARRIAHEIKNPLTPIQLSAERLTRKYLPQITSDAETFEKCTDTIVRQVEQIGRMVDEFSDFARMPEPEKSDINIKGLVSDVVTLQQQAYPNIQFGLNIPDQILMAHCDSGQMTQVLNNILQNAVDAIMENQKNGKISIDLSEEDGCVKIVIDDNGPGLPKDALPRLTEPYVTTRNKGTGLGLAIVKKILDDHNGSIDLENKKNDKGARITLRFEK